MSGDGREGRGAEPGSGVRLVLFDLDHTLIPFDSGSAWTAFLRARAGLPAAAADEAAWFTRQYLEGSLDARALHRWAVGALRPWPLAQLQAWRAEFAAQLPPRLPAAARALVQQHRRAGDLCAIVTATARFVSEPYAALLDVPHLVATESEVVDGFFTGEVVGEPCFQAGKIAAVARWLDPASGQGPQRGPGGGPVLAQARFYSDSHNDLPLLQAVREPVAVNPDARLRAHAQQQGWRIVDDLHELLDAPADPA